MFTGIITDLGSVQSILNNGDKRFVFNTAFDMDTVDIGASIACSGVCLTVVEKGLGWFSADVSAETLSKTTLGFWTKGTPVNFERALRMGDELGGHLVSGHVDGVASVVSIVPDGDSKRFTFEAPEELAKFIAPKGSIVLDGVSLTVNEVNGKQFGVNIIPHTAEMTTLGQWQVGSFKAGDCQVNLEIDLLARYVGQLLERQNNG
ncbi:riboflavin synthase subunit alpha [Kiloniella litopenaei]|uniref:Riboflavin synthase n=1 Tax=Kiloniella litopenaei TaxID=1549748 RepID=A0A0M2R8K3_9PROT|nr:riboflavin synthase [Kiloniella litopenaei]KKJ75873.1 riboflavin synthase subunit alpha [Kiloniella litopenaei]